jgi:hypothetical protein
MDFQRVELIGPDPIGQLILVDGKLAGGLVQLSDAHQEIAGQWFLEAGFGPLNGRGRKLFPDLVIARTWIEKYFVTSVAGRAREP